MLLATGSTTWSFASNPQTWYPVAGVPSAGTAPSGSWTTTDGFQASGSLRIHFAPASKNATVSASYWEISGSWASLFGISPTASVYSVSASYGWDIFTDVVGGAASTTGPLTLRDNAGNLLNTLVVGKGAGSTHAAWAAVSGSGTQSVALGNQTANTTIRFRLENSLAVGNSTSDLITMDWDDIGITIAYSATPPNFSGQLYPHYQPSSLGPAPITGQLYPRGPSPT